MVGLEEAAVAFQRVGQRVGAGGRGGQVLLAGSGLVVEVGRAVQVRVAAGQRRLVAGDGEHAVRAEGGVGLRAHVVVVGDVQEVEALGGRLGEALRDGAADE